MIAAIEVLFFRTRKLAAILYYSPDIILLMSLRDVGCWALLATNKKNWSNILDSVRLGKAASLSFPAWTQPTHFLAGFRRIGPWNSVGPTPHCFGCGQLTSLVGLEDSPDLARLEGAWRIAGKTLSKYAHVDFVTTTVIFTSTSLQPSGCLQKLAALE